MAKNLLTGLNLNYNKITKAHLEDIYITASEGAPKKLEHDETAREGQLHVDKTNLLVYLYVGTQWKLLGIDPSTIPNIDELLNKNSEVGDGLKYQDGKLQLDPTTGLKIAKLSEASTGSIATYQLQLGDQDTPIGDKIEIPKDRFLKSAEFISEAPDSTPGVTTGDPCIKLIVSTDSDDQEIFIPVKDLLDTYTAKENGGIKIEDNEISLSDEILPWTEFNQFGFKRFIGPVRIVNEQVRLYLPDDWVDKASYIHAYKTFICTPVSNSIAGITVVPYEDFVRVDKTEPSNPKPYIAIRKGTDLEGIHSAKRKIESLATASLEDYKKLAKTLKCEPIITDQFETDKVNKDLVQVIIARQFNTNID